MDYENDINYFDKTVDPAKEKVLIEVSKLTYLVLCPKAKQMKDIDDNEGESWKLRKIDSSRLKNGIS